MLRFKQVANSRTGQSTDLEDVDKAGSVAGQEMALDRLHEGELLQQTPKERPISTLKHLLCCRQCDTL